MFQKIVLLLNVKVAEDFRNNLDVYFSSEDKISDKLNKYLNTVGAMVIKTSIAESLFIMPLENNTNDSKTKDATGLPKELDNIGKHPTPEEVEKNKNTKKIQALMFYWINMRWNTKQDRTLYFSNPIVIILKKIIEDGRYRVSTIDSITAKKSSLDRNIEQPGLKNRTYVYKDSREYFNSLHDSLKDAKTPLDSLNDLIGHEDNLWKIIMDNSNIYAHRACITIFNSNKPGENDHLSSYCETFTKELDFWEFHDRPEKDMSYILSFIDYFTDLIKTLLKSYLTNKEITKLDQTTAEEFSLKIMEFKKELFNRINYFNYSPLLDQKSLEKNPSRVDPITQQIINPLQKWNHYYVEQIFVRYYVLMSQPWQLRNVLDNCSLMDNSIQKKLSEDRQSKSFYSNFFVIKKQKR